MIKEVGELKKCLPSKPVVFVLVFVFCTGFLTGRFTNSPSKVVEKEKSEHVVEKSKGKTHQVKKRIEKKADGSVVVEQTETETEINIEQEVDRKLAERLKLVERKGPSYSIGLMAVGDGVSVPNDLAIGGGVRVLGPVWFDAFISQRLQWGVGISFKF